MATKLFPTAQPGLASATFTTATVRVMNFVQGAAVASQTDATVASLVAAANPQGTGSIAPVLRAAAITLSAAGVVETGATIGASLFWVSLPIQKVTISGTVTANLRGLESNGLANYGIGCKLYKVSGGAVTAAFAQGSSTTEFLTTEAALSIALTPTSTAFANGDQIGALIFYVGVGTSASGRTATAFWNGAAAATGDTFFSFTETILQWEPRNSAVNFNDPAFF
jgi:hypothetical protein